MKEKIPSPYLKVSKRVLIRRVKMKKEKIKEKKKER
jgi:hypothetical protein